jgi:hypothetical protein
VKRICVVLLALGIIGGLYAQEGPPPRDWSVDFGGFGRGAFNPMQFVGGGTGTDNQIYSGIGSTWGFQNLELGLSVTAGSETIGVTADMLFNKDVVGLGNNAYAYVKPFNFVSMKFGKYIDEIMGGKIGDTDFNMFVLPEKNADSIFTRFHSGENTLANVNYETSFDPGAGTSQDFQKGFLLLLTPLKGLTLVLNLPSLGQAVYSGFTSNFGDPQSGTSYVWGNSQAAIGYEIDGIGHVRAQYIGVKDGSINANGDWELSDYVTFATHSRIEAAFAYTGLQGLLLDLGLKYYIPTDQSFNSGFGWGYSDYARGMAIGLGARYSGGAPFGKGAYAIEGKIDTTFAGSYTDISGGTPLDATNGINLNAHLVPSYNLGICTVGGEFGLEVQQDSKVGGTASKDGYTRFGIGAWAQRDLGMAKYIKIGVGATLPYTGNDDVKHGAIISVPIVFQYVFF